jgi:hypothetical protein
MIGKRSKTGITINTWALTGSRGIKNNRRVNGLKMINIVANQINLEILFSLDRIAIINPIGSNNKVWLGIQL